MPHTDPISDMITRINNAAGAGHKNVAIPASKIKQSIIELLVREGYLSKFRPMKDQGKAFFDVELKYKASGEPAITGFKRMSKPGLRVYRGSNQIPRVRRGYGAVILSTSKGILTDKQARKDKIGGELLCSIY